MAVGHAILSYVRRVTKKTKLDLPEYKRQISILAKEAEENKLLETFRIQFFKAYSS